MGLDGLLTVECATRIPLGREFFLFPESCPDPAFEECTGFAQTR
jgi:hypothetical protein